MQWMTNSKPERSRYESPRLGRLMDSTIGLRCLLLLGLLSLFPSRLLAYVYHVNCVAQTNGDGSVHNPLNSLVAVNTLTLGPGDRVMLLRSTSCIGVLSPQGSGAPGAPVIIGAYGNGRRPVIIGTGDAAVTLHNQQYLTVENLEIIGGQHYGLYYSSDIANVPMTNLRFINLDLHGAQFVSKVRSDSGEFVIQSSAPNGVLDNVMVDGVTAHDSTTSEGIYVNAGGAYVYPETNQTRGNAITVRNSTAHTVYGDGILIINLTNGLLDNNVVYESGLCPHCTGSTPGGLWEWQCHTCTVQNNESYANQTWGAGDGGDFDIDYHNYNNVVQYNYGHDSSGYCISVFGAEYDASQNNIIRYNICSNNERRVDASKPNQGDIFLSSWDGGSIDGIQIYNNTFYWNPATNAPLLFTTPASYSGTNPNTFKNNIIYSTVPNMMDTTQDFTLDNNIYWVVKNAEPNWTINGTTYTKLANYQDATAQDVHSYNADPDLTDPSFHRVGRPTEAFQLHSYSPALHNGALIPNNGGRDFFRLAVLPDHVPNIGAYNGPGTEAGRSQ